MFVACTNIIYLVALLNINCCLGYSAEKCCVPNECRRTCANPNPPNCSYTKQPKTNEDGCQCKSGYILSEEGGKCIKIEDCPKGCNGDPHAIVKECPVPCPATCEMPEPMLTCKRKCDPIGCECESGYILSGGKCILPDDCKGGNPCGETALFSSCKSYCPYDYCPVDDSREPIVCEYYPFSPCYPGCICKLNHKRKSREDNRCIVSSDCPPVNCTRPNEEWCSCPSDCLAETCEDVDKDKPICNTLVLNCQPKCICKPNTYRDKSDTCIGADECRDINSSEPVCGYNEEYVKCKTICPPQSCDISYTEYACGPPTCEPGCDCIKDHLRNKSGVCIPNNECSIQPVCGYNEEYVNCKTVCPPQSCDISYTEYACGPPTCEPGCDCIKDHLRNKSGVCIPNNECSIQPVCGYNEEYVNCKTVCPPQSCDISYTEYACGPPTCEPGCDCIKDHLRNKSGVCIPNNECPIPVSCPIPSECRPTCSNRNPSNCAYTEPSESNVDGCQCKKGYILSEPEGNCIKIEDCPLPKCGYNEIPASCRKICPPQQCGVDPAVIRCKKPDCEPGCDCIEDHLRNASGICIPSNKCLPKCGLHEIPVSCKIVCPPQSCLSIIALFKCPEEIPCEPGCDCQSGYLRNDSGVCIPSDQCFKSNCSIPSHCRPTCAVPNPNNCSYTEPPASNIDGCQCQKGYVLSDPDGKCVKVDECPQNIGCNGDPNAIIKECPWPCPSTCDAPNTIECRIACYPIGCQCQPGYLLSSINGECILPDKCKNGYPCGVNGTFSDCGFRCPNQYCPMDDDRTVIACKPGRPCPPGCLCKENYKRRSYQDDTCILASDCPPVNCTRPNEVWNSCPQCHVERCEDINSPILCDDPPGGNCQPSCVCTDGYYRDKDDNCVCESECHK